MASECEAEQCAAISLTDFLRDQDIELSVSVDDKEPLRLPTECEDEDKHKLALLLRSDDSKFVTMLGSLTPAPQRTISKARTMFNTEPVRSKALSAPQWTKSRDDALDLLLPIERRYLHKVHWLTDDRHVNEAFLHWKPEGVLETAVESPRGKHKMDVFTAKRLGLDAPSAHMPEDKELTPHLKPQKRTPLFQMGTQKLRRVNNCEQMKVVTKTLADGSKETAEEFLFPAKERMKAAKLTKAAKSRRIVFVDMKLKRMSDIDTSTLTFRCKFHFYLTWMATYGDVKSWFLWEYRKKENKDVRKWKPKWRPSLSFVNCVEKHQFELEDYKLKSGKHKSFTPPRGDKTDKSKLMYQKPESSWDISKDELGCDPRDAYWIRVRYNVEYSFSEELELNAFPFDCQNFSIFIKMDSDKTTEADLVPFPRLGEFLMLDSQFSVLSEWTLHNVVCEWKYTDPNESKAHWTYPLLVVHIKAARKWQARMSFILMAFCMQALGLCAFAISKEESIGERMSYCVMLLLADVTLLQLMFDQLPTISYVTVLDQIMWTCFGFLFLVTVWSAFDGDLPYIGDVQKADGKAFAVFACVYVLSIAYFALVSMTVRRTEMKKHSKTEAELEQLEKTRSQWWMWNSFTHPRCVVKLPWDRQMVYGKDNIDKKQMMSFYEPMKETDEATAVDTNSGYKQRMKPVFALSAP